jgi:hypothetical protein
MDLLIVLALVFAAVLLWLNFLAMLSVRYDPTLDKYQKIGQSIIVWLIPYIGSSLVLKFVYEHSPEAIPRSWIPWPFKKMVFGNDSKRYRDTGGVVVDEPHHRSVSSHQESLMDGGEGDGGE